MWEKGSSITDLIGEKSDPDSQAQSGQGGSVSEYLSTGVDPYEAAEGGEADGEGAQGKEDGEGEAHQDSVGDDAFVLECMTFTIAVFCLSGSAMAGH